MVPLCGVRWVREVALSLSWVVLLSPVVLLTTLRMLSFQRKSSLSVLKCFRSNSPGESSTYGRSSMVLQLCKALLPQNSLADAAGKRPMLERKRKETNANQLSRRPQSVTCSMIPI